MFLFPVPHIHFKKSIILLTNGRSSMLAGRQHHFKVPTPELLHSDQKLRFKKDEAMTDLENLFLGFSLILLRNERHSGGYVNDNH